MISGHSGFSNADVFVYAVRASRRFCSAGGGGVGHLLYEDSVTQGAGAQGGPVALRSKQGLAEIDELVFHDSNTTEKIVPGLQNRLARIVRRERLVVIPVEVAAITLRVFIGELKEAFTADHAVTDPVDHGYCRIGVANVGGGLEAGFCTGESLKEIRPEGPFVDIRQRGETWAIGSYGFAYAGGEHLCGKVFFNEDVPLRVPIVVLLESVFLLGDGSGWSGLDPLCRDGSAWRHGYSGLCGGVFFAGGTGLRCLCGRSLRLEC